MSKCMSCGKELTSGDIGLECWECVQKKNSEKNYSLSGWVCPKCGSVYSPDIKECTRCNNPYLITKGMLKE